MKLTEEEIELNDMEGYEGIWIPYRYDGRILDGDSDESKKRVQVAIKWAKQLKAQILSNQDNAEKWNELQLGISQMKSTDHMATTIGEYFAKVLNENQQLKEIVEKLKETYLKCKEREDAGELLRSGITFQQLKEILSQKEKN